MRLLVLGGTVFVGHAVAAEGVRRGHEVVCAARGESGQVPDGATLVRVDRDAEDGLAPLTGEFDAVVDVSPLSYPWVARALRTLGERAAHWSFVSTINVYADTATPGQTPATGELVPALTEHADREIMAAAGEDGVALYGGIKVASEQAVREVMGERAFVTRPGLITGAGDRSDRFGYWPARFARGGRVLVPAVDQPIQYLDVLAYASWLVDAGERGLTGTYDAAGPVGPLTELLAGIAEAVGVDVELVGADARQLVAAGVTPWSGPRSLPLWLPDTHHGMPAHDPTPSLAAGLPVRPLADAVADALARERELGLDRERRSGLDPVRELEILADL
ncbi:epimerase [Actinophytocola xinjiangensis]|uniref:Epimerase n=1 Tax=Actinophytocola xinjiangensis TaxID=485602 RepID=A0A7Z0WKJ2_9PSEU|nr:epimerase [Actinophytocola xinjiangensis]OLF09487.1 epimerase [Actinophytocola xinjiangensis]